MRFSSCRYPPELDVAVLPVRRPLRHPATSLSTGPPRRRRAPASVQRRAAAPRPVAADAREGAPNGRGERARTAAERGATPALLTEGRGSPRTAGSGDQTCSALIAVGA
ncbi:hypothetical protein Slala04_06590 [Streptomyces lavendulae subsp. lavendulae]|nr:hypothetical protein Slala04_06590 [Streptomyces lavendulae subsp. lavendulae]